MNNHLAFELRYYFKEVTYGAASYAYTWSPFENFYAG
jgi:hypothetical protein